MAQAALLPATGRHSIQVAAALAQGMPSTGNRKTGGGHPLDAARGSVNRRPPTRRCPVCRQYVVIPDEDRLDGVANLPIRSVAR
jgi:hypothetical protein